MHALAGHRNQVAAPEKAIVIAELESTQPKRPGVGEGGKLQRLRRVLGPERDRLEGFVRDGCVPRAPCTRSSPPARGASPRGSGPTSHCSRSARRACNRARAIRNPAAAGRQTQRSARTPSHSGALARAGRELGVRAGERVPEDVVEQVQQAVLAYALCVARGFFELRPVGPCTKPVPDAIRIELKGANRRSAPRANGR